MSIYRYIYNASTLRYERVGRSLGGWGLYVVGLLLTGTSFFLGLVFLQNYLVETPAESALRAENKALVNYKVDLNDQIEKANQQLTDLQSKDNALYEKIFESSKSTLEKDVRSNKEILIAVGQGFYDKIDEVILKYNASAQDALQHDHFYRQRASISKDDIALLVAIPSIAPVAEMDAIKLVSGYGIRINPFHKRNYHHDGIDVASPRGTEVRTAAPGKVVQVSHSELQAGFGNYVEIDHGHGYVTRYANLGEISVYYGKSVKKGEPIGSVGISGGSVAPHVHYEVLFNGHNVDPVRFLLQGLDSKQFNQIWQASIKQNQSLD